MEGLAVEASQTVLAAPLKNARSKYPRIPDWDESYAGCPSSESYAGCTEFLIWRGGIFSPFPGRGSSQIPRKQDDKFKFTSPPPLSPFGDTWRKQGDKTKFTYLLPLFHSLVVHMKKTRWQTQIYLSPPQIPPFGDTYKENKMINSNLPLSSSTSTLWW